MNAPAAAAPLAALHVANPYAALPEAFYTRCLPQPPEGARLLHVNRPLAHALGLSDAVLDHPDFLAVCAGQIPLPGGQTLAAVYSGHQFGLWAGQLGDGRAHLLGALVTASGPQEWQLKGSGRTLYSRMGDGRAVLRSSVREYLASEAMAGLGIPTTRALALVTSDTPVYRETVETAAIVSRLAPSFVRFGTFEHFSRSPEYLQQLLDHVVDGFYPDCRDMAGGRRAQPQDVALCFLEQVVTRTARLMADWMTVGFCHGVINTDNMSVLGLTLDYGPFGFMDGFRADHICNQTDVQGRYAWNVQPSAAHWNLYRLAGSLLGLDVPAPALRQVLEHFDARFQEAYHARMAAKFGLLAWTAQDAALTEAWWRLLHEARADFTLAFRHLATAPEAPQAFLDLFDDVRPAQAWLQTYRARLHQEGRPASQRRMAMNAVNPLYILRNHLAQQAIEAAQQGDASVIDRLLRCLRQPFDEQPDAHALAAPAPAGVGGLALSCSS